MVKYSAFFDLGLLFSCSTILIQYQPSELKREKEEKLKSKGFKVFKTVLGKDLR